MNIEFKEAITLLRIINRYLHDHPTGESAGEAARLQNKLRMAVERGE